MCSIRIKERKKEKERKRKKERKGTHTYLPGAAKIIGSKLLHLLSDLMTISMTSIFAPNKVYADKQNSDPSLSHNSGK